MDVAQVTQQVSEVALSVEQITGWIIKIVGTLAAVIVALAGVVAYLFKSLISEQKKWSETQLAMQKETNQAINNNTAALGKISEGMENIPTQIEMVIKMHLLDKK